MIRSLQVFVMGLIFVSFSANASTFGDFCLNALTGSFFGKPKILWGIDTGGLVWGPHMLRQVLGVGGGLKRGESLMGYGVSPFGELSVGANENVVEIELEVGYDARYSFGVREGFVGLLKEAGAVENPIRYGSPISYTLKDGSSGQKASLVGGKAHSLKTEFRLSFFRAEGETVEDFRKRFEPIVAAFFQELRNRSRP